MAGTRWWGVVSAGGLVLLALAGAGGAADLIRGSETYRAEVVGRVGVVAAGRHFAAEAGMRMLARGGNAVDAGVAATFAAAVTEISHFGLGGEVPILLHLADGGRTVAISGQGPAPAAASPDHFRRLGRIPGNGPSAGAVPAVVDALALALAEFGTLALADVLAPAIALADGFPWYDFLTRMLTPELVSMARYPGGARAYLQGPGGTVPAVGSVFRQPALAATLRALVEAERGAADRGRRSAIAAARDRFYSGDIGERIARAVQADGGLLTAADLAGYRGRAEAPRRLTFRTARGAFEVLKTDFWGQGPVLLQALALLEGFDLARMGHNSAEYIHTVTEALKLALADRDTWYGDPDLARVPAAGLLSAAYAAERRRLIDPQAASTPAPGDPWKHEPGATPRAGAGAGRPGRTAPWGRGPAGAPAGPRGRPAPAASAVASSSPDTTCIDVVDAAGNLFSAAPSSGWFFGGVYIAGDTGVPLGNRMQAFVLWEDGHPNLVAGGKRPRTTLSPTLVLRDGRPYLALSSPGGDSQDQQALQVLLNLAVFGMAPQQAVEAPRFNSLAYEESFGDHRFRGGALEVEDRIPPAVIEALRRLGHQVTVVGPFMIDTGTVVAGVDPAHGTLFGAADVRRQRFVTGW
jgi:gamma-glutamyltranspeptidase/glutathione hydrolase